MIKMVSLLSLTPYWYTTQKPKTFQSNLQVGYPVYCYSQSIQRRTTQIDVAADLYSEIQSRETAISSL